MKELDDRGFVFIDDRRLIYRCCMWNDKAWLFIWKNHQWISVRPVNQMEVWSFPRNLPEDQQELYLDN